MEFLRGEIGCSSVRGREIKNKLSYLKHIISGDGNKIVKKILDEGKFKGNLDWISRGIHGSDGNRLRFYCKQ